jgi:hypothetical protein
MDVFVPYSGLHALALAVCAVPIAAPALLGRALSPDAEMLLRRMLLACLQCLVELARPRFAYGTAAADLRLERLGGAAGSLDRLALGSGDFVFLDRRADFPGLRSTGAYRQTGLFGVLGVLGRAYDHGRLRCL